MKIPKTMQNMWQRFRELPTSTYVWGGVISLVLCWETAQTVIQSSQFLPNAPVPLSATLHGLFLPNNPQDHNNINPKVDWYGLEEHLYYVPISAEQTQKLAPIEAQAVKQIDKTLEAYGAITNCLDNEQIELLLRPQTNVAAIHSLGLDCGSREHQLYALHGLYQRSSKFKNFPDDTPRKRKLRQQRTPDQLRQLTMMDPTRLLVSLSLLLNVPEHSLSSKQADSLLYSYRYYCNCLEKLYRLHDEALMVLTPQQIRQDLGLAPRIWESSSSPVTLRETRKLILARTQGMQN